MDTRVGIGILTYLSQFVGFVTFTVQKQDYNNIAYARCGRFNAYILYLYHIYIYTQMINSCFDIAPIRGPRPKYNSQ